jgi:hypothetical protein
MLVKKIYREESKWVTMEIYVPQFLNDGSPVPESVFDDIEEHLKEVFGGFSMREEYGVWRDPETGITEDMINKVYEITYDMVSDPDATAFLEELIKDIGHQLGQQVMYRVVYESVAEPFIPTSQ